MKGNIYWYWHLSEVYISMPTQVDGLFPVAIQLLSRVSYSDSWKLDPSLGLFSFFRDGIFFGE